MDFTDSAVQALKDQLAPVYAGIVQANLLQKYPYHLQHLVQEPGDVAAPERLYPSFHTSYDWHSCVHMHWLGVRLLAHGLPAEQESALRGLVNASLTAANVALEAAYVRGHRTFERPYGWAWAARLAAACEMFDDGDANRWRAALEPLVAAVYANAADWATSIEHPVRHGVHSNTAFGLGLLISAARDLGREADATLLTAAALRLFGTDRNWAQEWELSGQDFLSAGLAEADLMATVLPAGEFRTWFCSFLPNLGESAPILTATIVTDPSDPQMAHLDGLNLSRAGALLRISTALRSSAGESAAGTAADQLTVLRRAAQSLLAAGLPAVMTEEYVSSHWLASFAWDALAAATT